MKELCQIIIYHINDTEDFQAKITGLEKWVTFNPLYILPDIYANNSIFLIMIFPILFRWKTF